MRRTWWKVYFLVILALTVLGLAPRFFTEEGRQLPWWEWLLIPLFVVQIVGLFGFAFWRRLFIPLLWQVVFLVSVANEVWDLASLCNPWWRYSGLPMLPSSALLTDACSSLGCSCGAGEV